MKKNNSILLLAVAIIALCSFTISSATSWEISKDFSLKFTSKDPSGVFSKMTGTVVFDENNLSDANFDLKVDVASINTGNGMQNKHAKSKKWFDAEKYPNIQFKSKSFSKTNSGYTVKGTMKIHGVEKEFDVPFTFKNQTFKAEFKVNRNDFNIGEATAKVPAVMEIDVTIPVTKK